MAPVVAPKYLRQGMIIADRQSRLVSTVLGSCVSVCLFDRQAGIGGINHYLLPFWNGDGIPTPKFGNIAIELLQQKLLELGATPKKLEAKIFGGAALLSDGTGPFSVGSRNIDIARYLLGQLRIPIVAEDVGGRSGRKIIFHTATGDIDICRHRPPVPVMHAPAGPTAPTTANPVDTATLLR